MEAASNITTVSWSVLIIYNFFFSLFDFIVIWISRDWFDETRPRDKKEKEEENLKIVGGAALQRRGRTNKESEREGGYRGRKVLLIKLSATKL